MTLVVMSGNELGRVGVLRGCCGWPDDDRRGGVGPGASSRAIAISAGHGIGRRLPDPLQNTHCCLIPRRPCTVAGAFLSR